MTSIHFYNLQMVHNLADYVEENIKKKKKLYSLLYADDAKWLAESPGDLQRSIILLAASLDTARPSGQALLN